MSDTASGLLDSAGRPIPRAMIARMREELGGTDALEARPPFVGHIATRLRPDSMASILAAADNGSTLDWQILAEEIEELFPHYRAVLTKRKQVLGQLPITVKPAGDDAAHVQHAEFVDRWLTTQVFQRALFHVMDAVGKGFSVSNIVWGQTQAGVVPVQILHRPARYFEISWQDGETLWLRKGAAGGDAATPGYETLEPPPSWLVHRHPTKSGLTIRSGLTRAVAFLWMASVYTMRDWALFVQTYGLPIRLGRYGPEASETDKSVLKRAVFSIAGDVAAILPRSTEIEFVQSTDKRAGADLYERRLDWLDREVSKLVLGSTAGTEAINGGHAVGRQHRQVEQDIERFDAGLVAATVNAGLIRWIVDLNFGPQPDYPTIMIGQPDQVPLAEWTPAVLGLIDRGLTVKARELRERLELTAPEDGDEVIGPRTDAKPGEALPDGGTQDPTSDLNALHLNAEESDPLVRRLTRVTAHRAAAGLDRMTEAVRHAIDQASDLQDLARRLQHLRLPDDQFAEAMSQGIALAHMAGRARMLDEAGLAQG